MPTRSTIAIRRFRDNASAATVVEYGLIVALISAVVMGALATTGQNITHVFGNLSTTLVRPNS